MTDWADIWERRVLERDGRSQLEALLAADGYDGRGSAVSVEAWGRFVRSVQQRLGLVPGDSVFEVGCGAGAFVYQLQRERLSVSGIDRSRTLVDYARAAIPSGAFAVADATAFATTPRVDAVISCGVFIYFDSYDYAHTVVERMTAKALRAVAILDVPDLARKEEALDARWARAGGREAYAAHYSGLEHLYYRRSWFVDALTACGFSRIEVADQSLEDYGNAPYRFNVFAEQDDGER